MVTPEIKIGLKKKLAKLERSDKKTYNKILKKIEEIINAPNIDHYKNLRYNLKTFKRVHIGHFVLIFSYDKSKDIACFQDFEHHDKIYQ